MEFGDFLSSAAVAALVAGLVSFRSHERKMQLESITQERAKWRETIMANALLVQHAVVAQDPTKLDELHLAFRLLLDPHDEEDQLILITIENLKGVGKRKLRMAEFSSRVALLLKHDRDRSRHEAKPWFLRFPVPKRRPYAEMAERRALWSDTDPVGAWDDRTESRKL
jgi:hypothetical protein